MALSMERALSDSGQWRASITYQSRCLDHTSNGVGLHGKAASSRVAHSLNLPVDNPLVWWRSRTLLRLLAMLFGAVVLFAILATSSVFLLSERRLQRRFDVRVSVPTPNPSLIELGAKLAVTRGCADCHGSDYSGKVIVDDPIFGQIIGDNLTRMPGDHAGGSVHQRMYFALHHGIDLDSRPLLMMPSKEFAKLSAREIEALSAYFASLSPVGRDAQESSLGPLGRTLLVAGKLEGFLSAEVINHNLPATAEPPPRGTLAYGKHTALLCTGCHQEDFGGGRMSHGGPSAPPAANLTSHRSGLALWDEEDFIKAMRHGQRPDGSMIDSKYMPWQAFGKADDDELRAIWMYLKSVPPVDRAVHTRLP